MKPSISDFAVSSSRTHRFFTPSLLILIQGVAFNSAATSEASRRPAGSRQILSPKRLEGLSDGYLRGFMNPPGEICRGN